MAHKATRQLTHLEQVLLARLEEGFREERLFVGDVTDPKTGDTYACVCIQKAQDSEHMVTAPLCLIPSPETMVRMIPVHGAMKRGKDGEELERTTRERAAAEAATREFEAAGARTGLNVVGGKDTKLH